MRMTCVGHAAVMLSALCLTTVAGTLHAQGRVGAPGPGAVIEGKQMVPDPDGLAVPVLVHEALPQGVAPLDRAGVATFGLPFSQAQAVTQVAGRPALAVEGAERWQFRTLDTWPDGSVRWALLDVLTEAPAGGASELLVVRGAGASPGRPLARKGPAGVQLDTGPLRAVLFASPEQPLTAVTVQGVPVLGTPAVPGFYGIAVDGEQLLPGADTVVILERTGPALAIARADGSLVDGAGQAVIDFTLRLTARVGSAAVEATLTVRNASVQRPWHAQLEAVELAVPTSITGGTVSLSAHDGQQGGVLLPHRDALLYQAYSAAPVTDLATSYLPHIPVVTGADKQLVEAGYQLEINGETLHALGDPALYAPHGWLGLDGATVGVSAAVQHMPYLWPAALEASASGRVVLGLFTRHNSVPYTWVWQQHESRTAVVAFHLAGQGEPGRVARDLDVPFVGRAAQYEHYDQAGVLPYRLITPERQEAVYAALGLDHQVSVPSADLLITRYLWKSTGGGSNNLAAIERDLVGEWLRHGAGGQYVNALDLALYKAEWQVRRSDDHVFDPELEPLNDALPHTTGNFGDDEHRYRSGMVLAYFLTGDSRLAEALFDEAEVLQTVSLWQHERSMYQTLRAMAWVSAFTGDPALTGLLAERLAWFGTLEVDVTDPWSFGWEAEPDDGARRYYVDGAALNWEKPADELFQARGFISASLGPLALHLAARSQPAGSELAALARGRLRDLAFWTREELFPHQPDPAQRRLAYSYAVLTQQITKWEPVDFHPVLLGMAEAFLDTGDLTYLKRGVQQIEAFAAHDEYAEGDNLHLLDTRLDAQHFFAVLADWLQAQGAL